MHFKWDGSDIGVIDEKCILEKHKIEDTNEELWIISVDGKTKIEVQVKNVKDKFQCLIDELKPIFGLFKQGTHFAICGKKKYMLIKSSIVRTIKGGILHYRLSGNLRDSSYDVKNQVFVEQVRAIYGFRYLFGITQSCDRLIRMRYYKYGNPEPVGTSEVTTSIDIRKVKSIPNTIMKKWFTESKVNPEIIFIRTLSRLVRIHNEQEIKDIELITRYSNAMYEIVNRIDKSYISYISMVIKRFSDILSHIDSMNDNKYKKS